jgi:putative intracellular protease/amidase
MRLFIHAGSKAIAASAEVGQILTKHYQDGQIIAAISAGSHVLLSRNIDVEHKRTEKINIDNPIVIYF